MLELTEQSELNKMRSLRWRKVAWGGIFAAITVLTLIPSAYIPATWLMLPFVGILFFYDDFYALWGMFLFFEDNTVIIPAVSLFLLYSVMVLFKFFVMDKCEKKIPVLIIPAVVVMVLYAMFAMPTADTTATRLAYTNLGKAPPSDAVINMRLIVGYALDCAVMLVLALRAAGDERIKRLLCKVVVCTAIFSGLFGYTADNIFLYGGEGSKLVRYMASFNDPNYAGFFFNMAIFIVLCLEDYKKLRVKLPLLIVFYYFLIASGSVSGLIFNAMGLVMFTIFRYRYKALPGLMALVVIVSGVGFLVMKIPEIRNLPVVANMEARIVRQFVQTEETESDLTSGRATQWKRYWGYFKEQEPEKKLFGGNMIMSYSVDQKLIDEFGNVPHQAYISFLLNFGIVGAAIIVMFFLCKLAVMVMMTFRSGKELEILFCIIACMWLFYGFGFDYFGDWRFMIYYFI